MSPPKLLKVTKSVYLFICVNTHDIIKFQSLILLHETFFHGLVVHHRRICILILNIFRIRPRFLSSHEPGISPDYKWQTEVIYFISNMSTQSARQFLAHGPQSPTHWNQQEERNQRSKVGHRLPTLSKWLCNLLSAQNL